MCDISIIIPVYNTPKYAFYNCMDSVMKQDFKEFEVVIIDDGSCRECADLIDQYIKMYKNIRVYHRKNQGVSSSRNFGAAVSHGRYIIFVDSDDILCAGVLKHVYEIAEKYNAEIVIGGTKYIENNTELESSYKFETKVEKADNRLLKKHLLDLSVKKYNEFSQGAYIGRGPWARLIKKEIFNCNLFDTELCFGEDVVWNQKMLLLNPMVYIDFNIWYLYIQNDFSAVHKFRENIIDEVEKILNKVRTCISDDSESEIEGFYNIVLKEIDSILRCYFLHPECTLSRKEKIKALKNTFKKDFWMKIFDRNRLKNYSLKNRIKIIFLRRGWIIDYFIIKNKLKRVLNNTVGEIICNRTKKEFII